MFGYVRQVAKFRCGFLAVIHMVAWGFFFDGDI
jgi:hypothetical protein